MGETDRRSGRGRRVKIAVLAVLAGLLAPAIEAQQDRRFALSAEHLVIHHEQGQRPLALLLLRWGEERCRDLARRLQITLPRRVHVYLFEDVTAFRQAGREAWDPWVAGVAWPERSLVWMPPAPTIAESRRVLAHELAHLYFAEATGHQALPRWLQEGAAQYLTGEIDWVDRDRVGRAMTRGGWISLERLQDDFPREGEEAALAYAEAALLLEFWHEWTGLGEQGVLRLVRQVRDRGSLEAALRQGWGMTPAQLEEVWRAHLQSRWRWARWWTQWETWLWAALLPSLVLWSYWRRRRRWERHWREVEEVWSDEA